MSILIKISSLVLIILILGCSYKSSIQNDDASKNISYQKNIELPQGVKCNIYFEQSEWSTHAENIAKIINNSLSEVSKIIKPNNNLIINVLLINKNLFKEKITSAHWVNAAFYGGKIYIPIKNTSTQFIEDNLKNTLKHEITHVINYNLSNGYLPAWLDEGLALLIENQPEHRAEKRYKEWLRFNKPIKLENLEKGFTNLHFDHAGYAYMQSKLMVSYLMNKYGRAGLQALIENFAKYKNTPNAFMKTFGISLAQFEEQFESKIKFAIQSGII